MQSVMISRREVLKAGGLAAAWAGLISCAATEKWAAGLDTHRAPVTPGEPRSPSSLANTGAASLMKDQSLHCLRRLNFGFTARDLEHARQIGAQAWLEEQMEPENLDDRPAEDLVASLPGLKLSRAQLLDPQQSRPGAAEFIFATLLRQVYSPRQVFEMLVDFWGNHFNIYLGAGPERGLKLFDDREAIRPNALATFRQLLQASAHSPAMLVYLNAASSTQKAPNENYARELLELHTVDVDGGYTQNDVQNLAHVLTGWSVVGLKEADRLGVDPGIFRFRRLAHDNGAHTVLGYDIPANSGQKGGEAFLDFLAGQASTAAFISRKLAARFVSDSPPQALVNRLAATFMSGNGDVKALLRALVIAPEFRSSAGQKFKRPLDFVVSLLRASAAEFQVSLPAARSLLMALRSLGQLPFDWPQPNGYPDAAGFWENTSGMLGRWNFAMQLMAGQLKGLRVDVEKLADGASTPESAVNALSERLLGEPLPGPARDILTAYTAEARLPASLPSLAGLIAASPYFQKR